MGEGGNPRPGAAPEGPAGMLAPRGEASRRRLRRVFLDAFEALDVAEPLCSFDAGSPAHEVRAFMEARVYDRVGVRVDGIVRGWVERAGLDGGRLRDRLRPFGPDDLVAATASLPEVIRSLAVNERCFVTVLGEPAAIVTLQDLEKPPVRMFLFGMVTVLEMLVSRAVEQGFPGERWREHVAPGRLAKAEELRAERERRGRPARLLDCLQFSDKALLAVRLPEVRARFDPGTSGKELKRAVKELEELRNHLAHSQEIIPTGWARIASFTRNLDDLLELA
jgi:hypothetical protein